MIECLHDAQQRYIPVNRKLYWGILGVIVVLFIVLAIVIVTYSTSSKGHSSGHADCSGHDQCPPSKACIQGKCGDPCEGVCGKNNTFCTVTQHIPACACKEGFAGNPFLGCDKQETQGVWPPVNGKKRFYEGNDLLADWQGAFMYCLRNKSRLASIDNMDELEDVRLVVNQHERKRVYWTSASDSGSEGNFFWASTGKELPLSSNLWMEGEPNNDGENGHCAEIHERSTDVGGFGLNDRPCNEKCYIICEYYE